MESKSMEKTIIEGIPEHFKFVLGSLANEKDEATARGNAEICLFMGGEIDFSKANVDTHYRDENGKTVDRYYIGTSYIPNETDDGYEKILPVGRLKYHSSWDWLMPVAKKILETDTGTMDIYSLYVSDSLRTADINKVWEAVIDFISWYNSQGVKPAK